MPPPTSTHQEETTVAPNTSTSNTLSQDCKTTTIKIDHSGGTIPIDSLQQLVQADEPTSDPTHRRHSKDDDHHQYPTIHPETIVSCCGDYRSLRTVQTYLTFAAAPPALHPKDNNNNANNDDDDDDATALRSALLPNAIQAYAHALLQHLRSTTTTPTTTTPIYFSQVGQFLDSATRLWWLEDPPSEWSGTISTRTTTAAAAATTTDEFIEPLPNEQFSVWTGAMKELHDAYMVARWHYAHLLDLWGEYGIDVETMEKHVELARANCGGIFIDFLEEMRRELNQSIEWQRKVDRVYQELNTMDDDHQRNDLDTLLQLLDEGKLHGLRSKAFVSLEKKIERVLHLQNRILRWRDTAATASSNNHESKETIKFTMALVREIHRFKVRFPVGNDMILFQQDAESWVERANIAIRSRISLQEIETLIDRGLEMPLDLSEYIEKLQSRATMATEWIRNFEDVIPCPIVNEDRVDATGLIARIRSELDEKGGRCNMLNHLSLEGSRLPVEIDIVKLLQVELDARAWVLKTKKYLPGTTNDDGDETDGNRKGKIEDLRDHVTKAKALRDRLDLTGPEKEAWVLDGETALLAIVEEADTWLDANRALIDGDRDEPVSIEELRSVVANGNRIFANLGNGATKLTRMLHQAESWYQQYFPLFVRCNLRQETVTIPNTDIVQLSDLKTAIDAYDLSIPLVEVAELQALVDKVEDWRRRAAQTKAKKGNLKRSQLFTIDDLIELIDESTSFHVDISAEVTSLHAQCDAIREWRGRASEELKKIAVAFQYLRETLNESFGPATEYQRGKLVHEGVNNVVDSSRLNVKSSVDQESILSNLSRNETSIHLLIKFFLTSSNVKSCIVTPESEMALFLEEVFCWCIQSIVYLQNQHLVFDKKQFTSFDRFILNGKAICSSDDMSEVDDNLRFQLKTIILDQQTRLEVLVADRGGFLAWCKKAENLLQAEDRRPSLAKIMELAKSSEDFPASCEAVQKVRDIAAKGAEWTRVARNAVNASGTEKLLIQDAKALLDEGEALGFTCDELKVLRNGIRVARGWSNKVKRAKVEEGGMEHEEMEALIEEHAALIVNMADEAAHLQTSMKRYCLCRRAMHSFMIACDECNDWFHGSCVGITERRAVDRVAKYVCLRCSLSKAFKANAMTCVNIIRKWVSTKEMKKFRQAENQKQKRKLRKESKDIETFQAEILVLNGLLENCNPNVTDETIVSQESVSSGEVVISELPQTADGGANTSTDVAAFHRNGIECVGSDELPTNCTLDENVIPNDVPMMERTHDSKSIDTSTLVTIPSDDVVTQVQNTKVDNSCTVPVVEVINEIPLDSTIDNISANCTYQKDLSRDEILSKLEKLDDAIQSARVRMNELETYASQQKSMDNEELKLAAQLRFWVIRVRSIVLFPSTQQLAAFSRPNANGTISDPMKSVIRDAELLGIQNTCDVKAIVSAFHRMAWCMLAVSIFHREPTAAQIEMLVNRASEIEFNDEKSIRTMKLLAQRVSGWQNKVEKAIAPFPGDTKPYNLDMLQQLLTAGSDIPVCIPIEQRLTNVIDDKGARYCLCGGPSDGRFMLSCDKCDRWFHGHCVKVKATENDVKDWTCPQCMGEPIDEKALELDHFHDNYDVSDEEDLDTENMKVPLADRLWPPYGLFGSPEATEALGEEVCKYQDSLDSLVPDAIKSTLQPSVPSIATNTIPVATSFTCATGTASSTGLSKFDMDVGYSGKPNLALSVARTAVHPAKPLPIGTVTPNPAAFGFGSMASVPQPELAPPSSSCVDDITITGTSDEMNGID